MAWFRSLVVVAVGASFALTAGAAAGQESAPPPAGVVAARGGPDGPEFLSADEVADYWTLDRLRAAQPVPLVQGGPAAGPEAAAGPVPLSLAKKVPGNKVTKKPFRQFGKIFFTIPGEGDFVCSGTAVKSPNQNLVLTAGHCVYDNEPAECSPANESCFVDNLVFIPAYRGNKPTLDKVAPFGTYAANNEFILAPWADDDHTVDFGFVTLDDRVNLSAAAAPGPLAAVEQEVGAHKVKFFKPVNQKYKPHGWPAEAPFDGDRLYKCKSNLKGRDPTTAGGAAPRTLRVSCNMTGGSSGGGWLTNVNDNKVGKILSVVSYGYDNEPGFFYGPRLGEAAELVYDFAVTQPPSP